jgi:methylmalonyl-CoA mutase C-terminal domain/subunit
MSAETAGSITRGTPLRSPAVESTGPRVKVVFGKLRFDAHDVGARYVMRKMVEAGMEVVFIRFALVSELVEAALQEDADVVAMSSLTGGHLVVGQDLMETARAMGIEDRLFIMGGVIADEDHLKLKEYGLHGVFGPGSRPVDIIGFIEENVSKEEA